VWVFGDDGRAEGEACGSVRWMTVEGRDMLFGLRLGVVVGDRVDGGVDGRDCVDGGERVDDRAGHVC